MESRKQKPNSRMFIKNFGCKSQFRSCILNYKRKTKQGKIFINHYPKKEQRIRFRGHLNKTGLFNGDLSWRQGTKRTERENRLMRFRSQGENNIDIAEIWTIKIKFVDYDKHPTNDLYQFVQGTRMLKWMSWKGMRKRKSMRLQY